MKKLCILLALASMNVAFADADDSSTDESIQLTRGGGRFEGQGPRANEEQQYRESEAAPAIRQQRQLQKEEGEQKLDESSDGPG